MLHIYQKHIQKKLKENPHWYTKYNHKFSTYNDVLYIVLPDDEIEIYRLGRTGSLSMPVIDIREQQFDEIV